MHNLEVLYESNRTIYSKVDPLSTSFVLTSGMWPNVLSFMAQDFCSERCELGKFWSARTTHILEGNDMYFGQTMFPEHSERQNPFCRIDLHTVSGI